MSLTPVRVRVSREDRTRSLTPVGVLVSGEDRRWSLKLVRVRVSGEDRTRSLTPIGVRVLGEDRTQSLTPIGVCVSGEDRTWLLMPVGASIPDEDHTWSPTFTRVPFSNEEFGQPLQNLLQFSLSTHLYTTQRFRRGKCHGHYNSHVKIRTPNLLCYKRVLCANQHVHNTIMLSIS